NLDYRSLVHHFENGVWLYKHEVLEQIKDDLTDTMDKSIKMKDGLIKDTLPQRLIRVLVRVLSPLL
ncbi:MAG: cardiolipin synthase, partial [Roseburia sp.]